MKVDRLDRQGTAPDRAAVLATVAEVLNGSGRAWAWQGAADAPSRWVHETGPKDLDVWCADGAVRAGLREALGAAVVADADDPRRLRHLSLAVETATGPAVVDLTLGDLRIGPVLLVPGNEVTADPATHRLTGLAGLADLLVRPVLRGRWPEPARLAEAKALWAGADLQERRRFVDRLAAELGTGVVDRIVAALGGARPDPRLPRRARARLLARSLDPGTVGATWAQRRTVLPAGGARGPLGLRTSGVVVALVGTDGAGKSTVAERLVARLRAYGFATGSAYFGMARGNLPGVGLARRLLGVPAPAAGPAPTARPAGLDHPRLRRIAAWYYAAEYVGRYLVTVAPRKRRRQVVIVDRWVYDLRDSPWPGSPAARVAQAVIPDPDILVLPDAPIEVIHARKPERPFADQAAQQERYRRLLGEGRARYRDLVVDTSGAHAGDPLHDLVNAVVEAAHRADR